MASTISRGIKTNIQTSSGISRTSFPMSVANGLTNLGRVTRVVLDKNSCTEDEWNLYQRSQAIGGVFYKELQIGLDGQLTEISSEKFAFNLETNIRRIPVTNEIVRVGLKTAPDLSTQNGNLLQQKIYWLEILPAWNHPHLNTVPDLQKDSKNQIDTTFQDQGNDINPLQSCPGDLIIEGRHGESLRFGGTSYESSPIATEETNGKAYVILRAGQGADNEGWGDKGIYEDINKDKASIYLTTAHTIPLEQAFSKRDSWSQKPVEAENYNKPQILLTSDRIWLNGREDIQLSGKDSIGLTSEQLSFDGQNQVSIDATKIYLGKESRKEKEPVLKGATTTALLSDLIDQFLSLLNSIVRAGQEGSGDPGIFVSVLQTSAKLLTQTLKTYKDQLPTLHSEKVFTE